MDFDAAQLTALRVAVDSGTFDAAARALHVTPSAVSQRIKALETATGRVLLVRAKPVRPTEAGTAVLRLARQVDALSRDVVRELGVDQAARTVVPITVNADSLATWFPDAIRRVDGVALDVQRADQTQTLGLLRSGSAMAAVTSEPSPVPGCAVLRLGRMQYRAVASPAFVRRWFADGVTADALAVAPVVVYDRTDDQQDAYLRRRTRRALSPPRHHIPDSTAFVRAVADGLGWGMVPDQQRPGTRLVDLDEQRGTMPVTLYWQHWRLASSALQQVTDVVRAAAVAALT